MASNSSPYSILTEDEEEEEVQLPLYLRILNTLLCRGDEDEDKLEAEPVPFTQLFRFATGWEKMATVVGVVAAGIEGALIPSKGFLMGKIADMYIKTKDPVANDSFLSAVLFFVLGYIAVGVLNLIVASIEFTVLSWVADRVVVRIKKKFVASVVSQDADFFTTTTAGKLSSQLTNNVDRIRDGIGDKIGLFARCFSMFVTTSFMCFSLDWHVSLIMIGVGPACALTTGLMSRMASSLTSSQLQWAERADGVAEEAITNVKTLASLNGQQSMVEKYNSLLDRAVAFALKIGLINASFDAFLEFLISGFYIAGLWFGIEGYHSGLIKDAASVLIIVRSITHSSYFLGNLGPHLLSILKARASATIVYATIDKLPVIDSRTELGHKLGPASLSLHFEDVYFSYSSRSSLVLRGLSLRVEEGETVALVGRSGCGKSTAISLLTRLYNIDQGLIRIGDIPIEKLNISEWRRCIGIVSQEPALFNGTIRENIQLGREISDVQVEEAARTANAHEFIIGLEKGYSTLLGPSEVSLSGGQKQRIAIARAIASNPRILLLDEATSALDTHSERVVQAALNKASAGRTTVVVAHRLSTIREADRIFVIDQGRVVEEGKYDELARREGGAFAAMVEMQKVEEKRRESHVEEESEEEEDEDEEEEILLEEDDEAMLVRPSVHRSVSHVSAVSDTHSVHEKSHFPSLEGGTLSLLLFDKTRWAANVIASCCRGLEDLIMTIGYQFMFRCFVETDYKTLLKWTMAGHFAIAFYVSFFIGLMRYTSAWASERVMQRLRVSCLSSILHRPMAYFDRADTSPAAVSVQMAQQPPLAMAALDFRSSTIYSWFFSLPIMLAMGAFFSWHLSLLAIGIGAVYLIIFLILKSMNERASKEVEAVDKSDELALEVFENVRTIQVLSAESYFMDRFSSIQHHSSGPIFKRTVCRALLHSISQSFAYFHNAAITALGVHLAYWGMLSLENLYLSENCVFLIGWCVSVAAAGIIDIAATSPAARQLFALMNPKEEDLGRGEKPVVEGALDAHSVSFAYPSRPRKLRAKEVSFSVPSGDSIAFVGPSGGGKSTFVNLLLRFYEPSAGELSLDSSPLPSLSLRHLRSNVSLVSQEPVLFDGSITENVLLGCEDASIEDVRAACRLSNCSSFIESFPEGYETAVGQRGTSLSGGQKQRIAIARALVRRPRVIVMDEASSALDAESQSVVGEALAATAEGRTSVIIAHRLDTVRHCSQICYVKDGRIMERGNHEELMEANGLYAALVREQRLT